MTLGTWGYQAWENDGAANWFDELFEKTGLAEHVAETLNLNVDEYHEEVRAAASLLSGLAERGVWPPTSRQRLTQLAAQRLQEIVSRQVHRNPTIIAVLEEEIASLLPQPHLTRDEIGPSP